MHADILDESFDYPQDFNLPGFWKRWCEDFKKNRLVFTMTARVSPDLIEYLPCIFGEHTHRILAQVGEPDERGRIVLTLPFDSFEAARAWVLSYGNAIEVLDPPSLRASVIDFARQTLSGYDQAD